MSKQARKWQLEAKEQALQCYLSGTRNFAIDAAPGAGKTFGAIMIAKDMIDRDLIDRVVVIAPRKQIATQWKNNFKRVTKRDMMKVVSSMFTYFDPSDMEDDIVCTWQGAQALQDVLQSICRNQRVMVIGDEVHHAALNAVWGAETKSALSDAKYALALTGTPNRSDGQGSIWLNDAMAAENYYQVSYKEAVMEHWCVPISFAKTTGELRIDLTQGDVIDGINPLGKPIIVRDDKVIIPEELAGSLDPSIKRQLDFDRQVKQPILEADGKTPRVKSIHADMLKDANKRLDAIRGQEYGEGGLPNAGALIIAPNIAMANYFDKLIRLLWPDEKPVVVNSQRQGSEQMIEKFARSDKKWIVSVNMVSEGVDITRLRVMVLLPNATTELYFRQALGRIIRKDDKLNGKKVDPELDNSHAYCVIPACEPYLTYARMIEEEMALVEKEAKVCSNCGEEVERKPTQDFPCPHCGHAPEPPAPKFWECSSWSDEGCGALNETYQRECHECGLPRNEPYDLTVREAFGIRDGVITRGEDFDEEAVKVSEEIVDEYRKMVLASGNQGAIRTLSTYPPEMVAVHAQIWANAQANKQQETRQ